MIRYYIVGSFALGALLFAASAYLYDFAWKRGKKIGYEEGVRDGKVEADNWWFSTESQVDQERQRLWRESGAA